MSLHLLIRRDSLNELQRYNNGYNEGFFSWVAKLFKSNKCLCGSKHKPVYNFPGAEEGMWCMKCRDTEMVDVMNKKFTWQLDISKIFNAV